MTNNHVANAGGHSDTIGRLAELNVFFPEYRNGKLVHEVDYYTKNVDAFEGNCDLQR